MLFFHSLTAGHPSYVKPQLIQRLHCSLLLTAGKDVLDMVVLQFASCNDIDQ